MRLESIYIKTFRCFDEVDLRFDDYTCMVGPNGAGKSTILSALNVFFREQANSAPNCVVLERDDFHKLNVTQPIEIRVTFTDLNESAEADFADYARQGTLGSFFR